MVNVQGKANNLKRFEIGTKLGRAEAMGYKAVC